MPATTHIMHKNQTKEEFLRNIEEFLRKADNDSLLETDDFSEEIHYAVHHGVTPPHFID